MKQRPQIIERLLAAIAGARRICVVGHIRPDGDCIGSQLGLTLALRNEGKDVTCWNQDPVPDKLRFLDPDRLVQPPRRGQKFDLVIATDCASFERLGKTGDCITNRKSLLNIDHHASNTRYGDVNWVSPREPSSGELIFRLLKEARWPITQEIADNLFAAISTDTGSFQYPTTRPATLHAAADLIKRGANLGKVCQEIYQSFPLARVKLVKHVYNRFHLTDHDRIAYFWLKQADFSRTGAGPEDAEGLIDHIRAIEPVVIAVVFEELGPELTRISLRSKDSAVNVNEVAQLFGGGGHSAAAGARIEGRPLAVQRRVIAAVKATLKAAK
ncbi:MAG: bifunctional oligoribonuclease/PAP phosphatase NrnA [Verrucomicrobia bacterium]|nr:bifunctional oligoribonuclease/PAP phosphatase NrnA [Verrucomicrobiota bacterium]